MSQSTNLNVSITQNYRLSTDGDQFILRRRHVVDPTKAPGYIPQEGGPAPEQRIEWRDPKFYPLTPAGLVCAVQAAIMRDTVTADAETIGEALALYREETERIARNIDAYLSPKIDGDLGALGGR